MSLERELCLESTGASCMRARRWSRVSGSRSRCCWSTAPRLAGALPCWSSESLGGCRRRQMRVGSAVAVEVVCPAGRPPSCDGALGDPTEPVAEVPAILSPRFFGSSLPPFSHSVIDFCTSVDRTRGLRFGLRPMLTTQKWQQQEQHRTTQTQQRRSRRAQTRGRSPRCFWAHRFTGVAAAAAAV